MKDDVKEATRRLNLSFRGVAKAIAQAAKVEAKVEAEQALVEFIGPYLRRMTESDKRFIEYLQRDFPAEKAAKMPPVGKVRRRRKRTPTV